MDEKTTETLTKVLKQSLSGSLDGFFLEHAEDIAPDNKPFSAYMRTLFKQKGIKQQDVFLAADISEGYGYKLISEEKHTKQRDVILRLCLAAKFSLEETQRALKLYGMSPLYPRMRRDAVLIVAINTATYQLAKVDQMLRQHDMDKLHPCQDPG